MKCVECGKQVELIPNRFPICECGGTNIVHDEVAFYIEICFEKGKNYVNVKNFNDEIVRTIEEPIEILKTISLYPIRNSEEIHRKILEKLLNKKIYNENEINILHYIKPTSLYVHYLLYDLSDFYRTVFHTHETRIIEEMIEGLYVFSHIDTDEEKMFPSKEKIIEMYKQNEKKLFPFASRLSLMESLSVNIDEDVAVMFANYGISIDEYLDYERNRKIISENFPLLVYINEFGELGYRGIQIFEKIDEYLDLISKTGIYFPDYIVTSTDIESIMKECRLKIAEEEKKHPLSKVLTDRLYLEVDETDIREVESENYIITEINPYEYFSTYSEHPGLWTSLGLIMKKPLKITDKKTNTLVSFVVYNGLELDVRGLVNTEIIKLINKYHDETEE